MFACHVIRVLVDEEIFGNLRIKRIDWSSVDEKKVAPIRLWMINCFDEFTAKQKIFGVVSVPTIVMFRSICTIFVGLKAICGVIGPSPLFDMHHCP